MKKGIIFGVLGLFITTILSPLTASAAVPQGKEKNVIYQLFVRTFGAKDSTRAGTGTFNSVNDRAVDSLSRMGVNTVWLTGVMEHASLNTDDPDVVKGNAGSPYAIRDYYDVNHELGSIDEFKALTDRFHRRGMKVIIDLVANHTARINEVDVKGKEHMAFGIEDDPSEFFMLENNFYYIKPDTKLVPPKRNASFMVPGYQYDGVFDRDIFLPGIQYEYPAKVSGNDIMIATPDFSTWFETVKLNYGFDFRHGGGHYYPVDPMSVPFNQLPGTWKKMIDVIGYWLDLGVDGFRCDIANMVPIAFWKTAFYYARIRHPEAVFLMEAYEGSNDPIGYSHEKMLLAGADALYSQPVYDAAKAVYQYDGDAFEIGRKTDEMMSNLKQVTRGGYVFYIENHDQIRSASRFFNGGKSDPMTGFVLTKFLFGLPGDFMIYNGQEIGETGDGGTGFNGDNGQTTIFDYFQMPGFSKWVNGFKYDGGLLSQGQMNLRDAYEELFSLRTAPALAAQHARRSITYVNLNDLNANPINRKYISAYARFSGDDRYIVVANFDRTNSREVALHLSSEWQDITGVLGGLGVQNSQNQKWCFKDVFTGFEPSDPNLPVKGEIPGNVLWKPYGVPSGIYLGKIPPMTVYYLKMQSCGT